MTVITPADAEINIIQRYLEGGALNECCGPIPIKVGRCRALKFLRVFLGTHTDGRRYSTITVVAGREGCWCAKVLCYRNLGEKIQDHLISLRLEKKSTKDGDLPQRKIVEIVAIEARLPGAFARQEPQ